MSTLDKIAKVTNLVCPSAVLWLLIERFIPSNGMFLNGQVAYSGHKTQKRDLYLVLVMLLGDAKSLSPSEMSCNIKLRVETPVMFYVLVK